ncbi:MAG: cytochrome b/b6 domain-containing protein [Lautropia sp.]
MRVARPGRALVWRARQRIAHWVLAGSVLGCLWLYEGGVLHQRLGYLALTVAAARVVLGLVGARVERFASFVRGPSATFSYARALLSHREPRYRNHNPLGGWMVMALLIAALAAGASGALYDTDRFWGDALVYEVHRTAGWSFLVLVPLHVAGVALASVRHRENLVRAMVDGFKREPGPDDIG